MTNLFENEKLGRKYSGACWKGWSSPVGRGLRTMLFPFQLPLRAQHPAIPSLVQQQQLHCTKRLGQVWSTTVPVSVTSLDQPTTTYPFPASTQYPQVRPTSTPQYPGSSLHLKCNHALQPTDPGGKYQLINLSSRRPTCVNLQPVQLGMQEAQNRPGAGNVGHGEQATIGWAAHLSPSHIIRWGFKFDCNADRMHSSDTIGKPSKHNDDTIQGGHHFRVNPIILATT